LKAVSLELEVETELLKLFDRAVDIANSIRAVCMKLVSDNLILGYSRFRAIDGILCIFLYPDDLLFLATVRRSI
jgi:hypothetical protein